MAGDENQLLHNVLCIAREYREGILDATLMVRLTETRWEPEPDYAAIEQVGLGEKER